MDDFELVSEGNGEYRVRAGSHFGSTAVTIALGNAYDSTGGRLTDDEATARAAIRFLLSHQDAADLPPRIDIEDVFAAYPDAVDSIEGLRG